MSILGSILSTIFGHAPAAPAAPASSPQAAPGAQAPAAPKPAAAPASGMPPKPATPVNVEAILNKLAAQSKEKLNWRLSIVDLMKLLNLDSSLTARKALADELHYTGNKNDTATMNIWLHKQVMQKLADNGGKVPDDLRK
jgi:hypothetical protein